MQVFQENEGLFVLQLHPQSPAIVDSVELILIRNSSGLHLKYTIKNIGQVLLPSKDNAKFADELWRHTCCELFIRPVGGNEYIEFNFSPSTEYAIYHFDRYREGMKSIDKFIPNISTQIDGDDLIMNIEMDGEFPEGKWDINVSSVIESKDGDKSYFALLHKEGGPDFHAPECFIGRVR